MSDEGSSSNSAPRMPEWLVPGYPPLKAEDSVGQAAVEGQLLYYPRVGRTFVDPQLQGQKLGLISFLFFKETRILSSGKPVYGYFKLRGNYPDDISSKSEASKIIREIDSKFEIRVAPVGAWLPITEETAFVKEMLDVKTERGQLALRDQAVKEKEAEQRRIQREIREREDEATSGDIYDDPTSLTYYSMKRVTEIKLIETRENLIRQLDDIAGKLIQVQRETKLIEREHPEYLDDWIDRYNTERRKAGVPDYVPSEAEEREHREATFESSDEEEEE